MKEYKVGESLKIFREAGFTRLEDAEMPPSILELLTNLDKLPEKVTLISLPLKIREGDGSPVRAVALVD